MRTFIRIAAVGAALAGNVALAAVQIGPTSLDFGPQSMGTTSPPLTVTISNTGPGPITVTSVSSSNGQFTPSHSCTSIAEGAGCPVSITFTPAPTSAELETESSVGATLTVVTSAGSPTAAMAGLAQKSLVTHFYRSILRRAPEAGGALFWRHEALRLQGLGANPNEVWYAMSAFFLRSAEYVAFNRNDIDFLTDLYRTFFSREPDAGGMSFWQAQLAQGMPREVVVNSFMFSTEFRDFSQAIFGNAPARQEIDVVMDFYRGMLARLPDENGFAAWTDQLRTRQCTSPSSGSMREESIAIANAFANEHGGRNRSNAQYVGDLYNAILRRGGDLQGVQAWVQQLDSGTLTRAQVREQFFNSDEFAGRAFGMVVSGCISHGTVTSVAEGQNPSAMVGDDGVPLVAFFRGSAFHVARCNDAACSGAPTVTQLDTVGNPGSAEIFLSRGANGLPVAIYRWDSFVRIARCGNAACSSGNQFTTMFPNAGPLGALGRFHGLGEGADGAPIVVQENFPTSGDGITLRAVKCTTPGCTATASNVLVDGANPPSLNLFPATTLGGDGLPITAFYGNGTLRTAHCADAGCASVTLATVDPFRPDSISIDTGSNGLPGIAFGSFANSQYTVRYARCSQANCASGASVSTVVPYTGATAISQAVSPTGLPFMATAFGAATVIKVVACGDASCAAANKVTTLGGPGIGREARLGSVNAVAMRPDGRPVIAFMSYVNLIPQVRLLSCANAACTPVAP